MLEFECPNCKAMLNIPEQFLGTAGTCKKCGKPITIEVQATHDTETEAEEPYTERPPVLVAFHCETTGPSVRKCNLTELAGVKFDLNGNEIDTFASFANPGHLIPPRIFEKTGITDEMVEHAPSSVDVVKQWVEWIGPHVLLFSHHAHFDAKFVAGTLLKEDVDPPRARIMDVTHWARTLTIPVEEYRLRPLLDYMGYRVKKSHRALDTCHGVAALVGFLAKRQAGAHMEADESGGMIGRLMGKKTEAVNQEMAYRYLQQSSRALESMCGDGFYEKVSYDARLKRVKSVGIASGGSEPFMPQPDIVQMKHPPHWYEEISRGITKAQREHESGGNGVEEPMPSNAPWEYILLEASETSDRREQKGLCQQAVNMEALDPWPYERLMKHLIHDKDYEAAQLVCEQYFDTDNWKVGRWAETSRKLLKRLEKLERKLAEKS